MTKNLANANLRALVSAILFFAFNLIGLGLGPLCIGFLSDLSLRYAFCSTFLTGGISIVLFYFALKFYKEEVEAV